MINNDLSEKLRTNNSLDVHITSQDIKIREDYLLWGTFMIVMVPITVLIVLKKSTTAWINILGIAFALYLLYSGVNHIKSSRQYCLDLVHKEYLIRKINRFKGISQEKKGKWGDIKHIKFSCSVPYHMLDPSNLKIEVITKEGESISLFSKNSYNPLHYNDMLKELLQAISELLQKKYVIEEQKSWVKTDPWKNLRESKWYGGIVDGKVLG